MTLKVYNTLTKKEEEFKPLHPPKVNMYVCGITPYDETHLGHGRAYVTFDIIFRYLEHLGFKVNYIQNITDIDDKIIKRANGLGKSTEEIASRYTEEYFKVTDALNIRRANKYPKATKHIEDMIEHIKKLIEKGFAYVVDGDVYFEIVKFKDYGKLSGRDKKSMMAGARVEVDERKKDPLDFALWKSSKPGEPSWDSPWGKGRPGWHIECSTMSTKYLGETFDIHGGGLDLIFPHHENEIAQAEAVTGKPFVKYWIHNGFVTVNKEKMSKSLGNFFTLREIFEKFSPEVVRFFLLSTHYRSPINFSDKQLSEAEEALSSIKNTIKNYEQLISSKLPVLKKKVNVSNDIETFKKDFETAMDDDFNTAHALAVIFNIVYFMNEQIKAMEFDENVKSLLLELLDILGIDIRKSEEKIPSEVKMMIREREEARKKKDFEKADLLRNKLLERGIILEDTPFGVRWKGKIKQ